MGIVVQCVCLCVCPGYISKVNEGGYCLFYLGLGGGEEQVNVNYMCGICV